MRTRSIRKPGLDARASAAGGASRVPPAVAFQGSSQTIPPARNPYALAGIGCGAGLAVAVGVL